MWILLFFLAFSALTVLVVTATLQLNAFSRKLDELSAKLESHLYL